MIAVIDYGMGNLGSVAKAFKAIGARVTVSCLPKDLKKADKIVLPGVGAFGDSMAALRKCGLIAPLKENIKDGKPFLGLCLGLQLLFEESEESGKVKGLGVLKGKVKRFSFPLRTYDPKTPGTSLKVPHMGWNRIRTVASCQPAPVCAANGGPGLPVASPGTCPLLKGIPDGSWMYFVHSYYVVPKDKNVIATTTDYGVDFTSMVWKDNIYAMQEFCQMLVIPATDLLNGKVARLTRGNFKFEKVYSDDPVGVAKKWEAQGARRIHLVDLDGAVSGEFKNLGLIEEIIRNVKVPVELGGGVRSEEVIEKALKSGVSYVIIGTRLVDEKFSKKVIKRFKDKLIMGVDAKDGKVAVSGWTEKTELDYVDFIKRLKDQGAKMFIFTDIAKDGMLQGPNADAIKRVLKEAQVEVIASGGISSIDDLLVLKRLEVKGLTGAIVGKALYENKINLKEAIEAVDKTTDF
ncbi:MAG: 1-(5-phosphoribosyl)-5-[(5-phosphoribosylamino)methylideneamino]imidazole-4-carboxamide isomerase [Candidatus Omnitrophica bacterium]|nr:1-(5-phosphoribosyl)-5-[(5-phosphoribosylamino)methylideneamino]imidazole-4-carboxamide isomerase [Candidatus Omnitrophota bacterium]